MIYLRLVQMISARLVWGGGDGDLQGTVHRLEVLVVQDNLDIELVGADHRDQSE